jgi:hypothetical protein
MTGVRPLFQSAPEWIGTVTAETHRDRVTNLCPEA